VEPFAGFEPQIGEIRAVRTFRIGPRGVLYPLFSDLGWAVGTNTARCNLAAQVHPWHVDALEPEDHQVPEPDCSCGYYAYASEFAASEYPNAQHVLAVVSCWGRVIAGTRGIRAQHARLEAIWMSMTVPPELAAEVTARYEDASVYSDRQLMLTEHPPTVVDCYELDGPERAARRRVVRAAGVAGLALGLVPSARLTSNLDLLVAWWAGLVLSVAGAVLSQRRGGVAAHRRAMQLGALAMWLLAPFGGAAGIFLLRLPMIQLAALINAQRRILVREATRFPARIANTDP
jgi:hypothetical protein